MSYRTVIDARLRRILPTVGLSDFALVEVLVRLMEDLCDDPKELLHQAEGPAGGLYYAFEFIDPENRLCTHQFSFRVLYGQDEETLQIPYGNYAKIIVL